MRLRKLSKILVFAVAVAFPLNLQALECPAPVNQIGTDIKIDIEGSAGLLLKWIGSAKLKSEVEIIQKDFYHKYPNADRLAFDQNIIAIVCTGLRDDDNLNEQEKINRLLEIRREFMQKNQSKNAWGNVKITTRIIEGQDVEYPHIEGLTNRFIEPKINSQIKRKVIDFLRDTNDGRLDLRVWYDLKFLEYNLLGLAMHFSEYSEGAAHPQTYTESISLDLDSGKFFEFSELFLPGSVLKIDELVKHYLKKKGVFYPCRSEVQYACFKSVNDDASQYFYITDTAVVLVFMTYGIAPYSEGVIEVPLQFDEIGSIANSIGPLKLFL